ncbi:MAG: dynamin family protein, partial [Myxococcota bacterium]
MARVAENLARFFSRVEILARGAEEERRAAEDALAHGRHLEARAHARALLARVPRSPLGLALWAEAAEALWLHGEAAEALEELSRQVPWRQEVWLRLGLARVRAGIPEGRQALGRAASLDDPAVRREALLALIDLDLAAGEPDRAERWLGRLGEASDDLEVDLRRAECAFSRGREDEARLYAEGLSALDDGSEAPLGADAPPLAGRVRLLYARLAARFADVSYGGDPLTLALGALLLDAPGAEEVVAAQLRRCRDAALVDQARQTLEALGRANEPRWQAAFAFAEGRDADARAALLEAAEAGDAAAARELLRGAIEGRRQEALADLTTRVDAGTIDLVIGDAVRSLLALGAEVDRGADVVEELAPIAAGADDDDEALRAWAQAWLDALVTRWVPPTGTARWDTLLPVLRREARRFGRDDLAPAIEGLGVERRRPLYVAVLGEFNAGKSTLLNALLGTDVAPTGVRPTTATLHWVAWAPDRFARICVSGQRDRVVPHGELKRALHELEGEGHDVARVYIYAPIERLKRIELLDTPGFNAPVDDHAAQARRGIDEAHVALWLLDGTAPLKDSERRVLDDVVAAGLPLQVLVNKRDRIGEGGVDRVRDYVVAALAERGIETLAPPVVFSARQALAGRQGDADALAASCWPEVEALLNAEVVDRSDVLREQALRRKAARVVSALAEAARAERRATEAASRRR